MVVLEARDRIGGRINTGILGDGKSKVDFGASFIHGTENSVISIANELGVELKAEFGGYKRGWLDRGLWYSTSNRKRITKKDLAKANAVFDEILWNLGDRARDLRPGAKDVSVAEFLTKCIPLPTHMHLEKLPADLKRVVQKMESTVWGYVGPLDRIAASSFRNLEDDALMPNSDKDTYEPSTTEDHNEEEEEDSLVVEGYSFLVDYLSRGIDVRLNKIVRTIVRRENGGASVFTSDGYEFAADAVIVTVPLGVLKGEHPESRMNFIPALSDAKLAAIKALDMGVENKLVMRFAEPFWPINASPFIQVTEKGVRFLSLHHYGKPGVLVAHFCPPLSQEIQDWDDGKVVDFTLDVLFAAFGRTTDLEEGIVTRWGKDPFALGSYSYLPVGASYKHQMALKKSEGCLYFAGEATSKDDYQCVVGAYDTGQQAAKEALIKELSYKSCMYCNLLFDSTKSSSDGICGPCENEEAVGDKLYCYCQKPNDDTKYVQCSVCDSWFHYRCVGLEEEVEIITDWYCKECEKKRKKKHGYAKESKSCTLSSNNSHIPPEFMREVYDVQVVLEELSGYSWIDLKK